MATKNLFASLQQIASESVGSVSVNDTGNEELIDSQDIGKIREVSMIADKMYPNNNQKKFDYWKKNINIDGMSDTARKFYWKQYEQMHPRGIEGAKTDFVDVTLREAALLNGVSNKEFFLRDRLSKSPEWAQKALAPELAKYSTSVANANFSKASQVYGKSVEDKMNKFVTTTDLDPDIAIDDHTSDFVRMEQLNLFDVASVVNGRIGAYDQNGQFIPGFAIKDRKQIFPNDPFGTPSAAEQVLVRESVIKPIKAAIEGKIYSQRSNISSQERAIAMNSAQMLEKGDFTIDRWGEAFSINPEATMDEQITRAIRGEIYSGRVKTQQELAETIYTAMTKYPSMFGDLNGTTAKQSA